MPRDQAHRFAEKAEPRRDPMPGRGAGWMRQRNQVEAAAVATKRKGASDDFVEFFERKELGDRELTDRNNEPRLEEIDLIIHPGRTIPDLVRGGNPVAARSRFPGKATAYRREIDLGANLFFTQSAELLKPAEEGATRCPGEWLAQHRLFHARRLADEHHFAQDRSARNRWRQHPGATPALQQARDMFSQRLLFARDPTYCHDDSGQRRKIAMIKLSRMLMTIQVTIGK